MWLKLDDNFGDHPKIVGLSDRAFRAHLLGMLYAARHLTDGHVPPTAAPTPRTARELEDAGLWERNGSGWVVHDWQDWNPASKSIRDKQAADRDRKRNQRRHRGGQFGEEET